MENTKQQPLPVKDPEKFAYQKSADKVSFGMLLYAMILVAAQVAVIFVYDMVVIVKGILDHTLDPKNTAQLTEAVSDTSSILGIVCTVSVIVASLFLMIYSRKRVTLKECFAPKKKMTPAVFFTLLAVVFAAQLPNTLIVGGLEMLLNLVGLSIQSSSDAVDISKMDAPMFIYAAFVAPVIEELVFRGFSMNGYQKVYPNKMLAIVVTSFAFSMMHGNFTQFLFAFAVGLVFAYAAMEYGLVWSIALHFLNNFGLAGVLALVLKPLSEEKQTLITYIVISILFVIGAVVFWLNRKKASAYIKENTCEKKYYKWALTSIPLIIYCAYFLINAVVQVAPKA